VRDWPREERRECGIDALELGRELVRWLAIVKQHEIDVLEEALHLLQSTRE
jgi:hypothetical protein